MEQTVLTSIIKDVLAGTPYKPFLCLPMSAILYAILKDKYSANPKLVTGNLKYKNDFVFKQDFSIQDATSETYQLWAGHAWVEIDNLICDLSFMRTLYSVQFTKSYKTELIELLGEGKGCLILTANDYSNTLLKYEKIDYLSDDLATGIIRGTKQLLQNIHH